MHIAEALLEADDRLAARGEAEMAGLDDAGVHRPDGNLVQVLSFRGEERIGRGRRLGFSPTSVIEPRPLIGRVVRYKAEEVADGPFKTDRRRMGKPNRWKHAVHALEAHNADRIRNDGLIQQRHVDRRCLISPEAEQGQIAVREFADRKAPDIATDDGARPRPVMGDELPFGDERAQHRHPSIPATF